jgi:3-methyl-2-oxobutanoate hydroxymethyltransferase
MIDRVRIPELVKKKRDGQRITMVTAYDFPFGQIADESGVDIVLIGDSLGVVVQGRPNTLAVTMEQMLYHTELVGRAVKRALVVGDMPFLSFQVSVEEAVRNAGHFLAAGAGAVKVEGGAAVADRIEAMVRYDIPVMGHVGLTPQSIHRMGGYKVQGRDADVAGRVLADAKAVEAAGAFAVVLEGIPLELGRRITQALKIPTIGIGAGPHCDGQVLVCYDMLGLSQGKTPSFVKKYAELGEALGRAAREYASDVRSGRYPAQGKEKQ